MKYILIALALLTTACASSQSGRKPSTAQLATPIEQPQAMDNPLVVHPLAWVGSFNCPPASTVQKTRDWKDLIKYANRCLGQKKFSETKSIAMKIAEVEPQLPWGAYYLSLEAEMNGQDERALWMIDAALKKANNIGVLKYQKGRLLWKKGFLRESVREVEEALTIDPNIMDAHLLLGEAYLTELNFKVAKTHFERVLQSTPTHLNALAGIIDIAIELENATMALSYLQTALSTHPRNLGFRLKEAFVYENLTQQTEVALSRFKDIQKLLERRALDGQMPFDINAKIKDLEAAVKGSGKRIALRKSE